MEPIRITVEIGEQDYRSIMYFNLLYRKKWFPLLLAAAVLLSVVQLVRYAVFDALTFSTALPSFTMLFLIAAMLGMTELSIRRFVRAGGLKNSRRDMVIDENGIGAVADEDETPIEPYAWKNFTNAYELKSVFLMFLNIRQAVIIPKKAFTSEELEFVRELLSEKLGKKFEKRA